jgi:hypothetical protein
VARIVANLNVVSLKEFQELPLLVQSNRNHVRHLSLGLFPEVQFHRILAYLPTSFPSFYFAYIPIIWEEGSFVKRKLIENLSI